MNAILTTSLLWAVLAAPDEAATDPAASEAAAEAIAVEVTSGRTFAAAVDARTDEAHLWLRWQAGSAVLLRPIRWDRVTRARVAGKELSGAELLGMVRTLKAELAGRPPDVAEPKDFTPQARIVLRDAADPPPFSASPAGAARALLETLRVRSLAIDAEVGRWDANVEADGLLVRIYPLDATGAVVAVRGTLDVELIGRETGVVKLPQPFARLGYWSQQVSPDDFGGGGAVYRLPFQGVHPEFDLTVAPRGAVHARLSVPGQGTFEATAAMVRIRPYSSVRDHLQQSSGRRFFPQETTRDGRH